MLNRAVLIFAVIGVLALSIKWSTAEQRSVGREPFAIPETRTAAAFAVSPAARDIAAKIHLNKPIKGAPLKLRDDHTPAPSNSVISTGSADGSPARTSLVPMPATSLSFDGLSNYDNIAAYNLVILPPDMSGDVGPDHYVQTVNALVRVYDKNGSPLIAPFKFSDLFAPIGGPCSTRNDGLPVVLYDTLADRWLISQYCYNVPPFRQMVAVSKTGDPTGEYYVYEFAMPNVRINDFSKFGIWPDGYYMSTEEYLGSDFAGSGLFAFDRAKLLVGDPNASYIYFNRPSNSLNRRSNFVPSDLDGLRPPAVGAPNTFISYAADEYGDAADAIRLFDLHADFADPLKSTLTERQESPLAVAAFDPTSPDGRTDIAQPAPGEFLDSNSDRVNFRVAYRNFGGHESLVFNQTVRLSQTPYRAGVRMYELRRSGGGAFSAIEQSTIGDSGASRWIGNSAQDHQGNLAVSYNLVSDVKQPSIKYTGRLATEPAGTFRTEGSLVEGTGVQKAFGWRWGDYGGMTVDPVDDCTFWTTGEYFTQESQDFSDFTWLTRIGRFKFDECTPAPRSLITGTVTNAVSGLPLAGAKLTASAYSRTTSANGSYGNMAVLPGTYSLTASAKGYRSQTVTVSPANGQTVTQNFALQPVAEIENGGIQPTAESCGTNGTPEPGETVTYSFALKNTGSLNTQDLVMTLLPTGGVTGPSSPQNYGALTVNGPTVTRPFTFTVASGVTCGSPLTLSFQLRDGSEDLGTLVVRLTAGVPKIAFRGDFDRLTGPGLPQRWMTSASGAQTSWRASRARSVSGPKSLFSPDPNQIGLNELISPVFRVGTTNAELTFQNWYELETTFLRNRLFDGSVLEIRIGSGDWQDIVAAGGQFISGGYDGAIDGCCQNPLAGRQGWSGRSGINPVSEFITTRVKLPATAAGQLVQLRWRVGTDIGTFREGQYIDDLQVTDGFVCGCSN
ncbi:MAG: carboxypeptidase regulatory-like domain-containing protein [Pyrinomonadaceae bacterium]|nr:carboxypeptidase regulatory-like domain-containing protein [Pyrinomonadaceae bacterium]MBP6211601.1 carboxypeptidase regulatory-like domain-containing protein [Pyrinomonadaceae bacterium]